MLLQFTIENFLSFRERTVFSMLVPEESSPPAQSFVETQGLRVLRAAALYGANASGKSNFVKALQFCQQYVLKGRRPEVPTAVEPFRLAPATREAPSQFEFELLLGDSRWSYGFRVDARVVLAEWLNETGSDGREQVVFDRDSPPGNGTKSHIELGPRFGGERLQFLRFVGEGTRPNQLFLAEARERNASELATVATWFERDLRLFFPDSTVANLLDRVADDEPFRNFLESYLSRLGTGVAGLRVERHTPPPGLNFDPGPPDATKDPLARDVYSTVYRSVYSAVRRRLDDADRLLVRHVGTDGKPIEFDEQSESDGTRRLMHVAPALHSAERAVGCFCIDELDRSLHPLMTRRLVADFLVTEGSRQLIFTTHDTNLLAADVLPAESVWFTEQDPGGGTHLYSLAEFDAAQLDRFEQTLEQGYLAGRFGAIPFFADRARLGWPPKKGE
jgi:hypothetical protein